MRPCLHAASLLSFCQRTLCWQAASISSNAPDPLFDFTELLSNITPPPACSLSLMTDLQRSFDIPEKHAAPSNADCAARCYTTVSGQQHSSKIKEAFCCASPKAGAEPNF